MTQHNLFKTMAAHVKRGGVPGLTPRLIHPDRDWWLGLGIATLLFLGTASWSVRIYSEYRSLSTESGAPVVVAPVPFRTDMVTAAESVVKMRNEAYTALLKTPTFPVRTPAAAAITTIDATTSHSSSSLQLSTTTATSNTTVAEPDTSSLEENDVLPTLSF